jgi:hypothetical protein
VLSYPVCRRVASLSGLIDTIVATRQCPDPLHSLHLLNQFPTGSVW